jgi:hypothetical protein
MTTLTVRRIQPARLPRSEAMSVLDRVIDLDAKIFRYRSAEGQARYYQGLRQLEDGEKIVILYEQNGVPVGFNLVRLDVFELDGKRLCAVGSNAGFLPGYRGGSRTFPDAIAAVLPYRLRWPGLSMWFVSAVVHPNAYALLADTCPEVFPSVGRPAPRADEARVLLAALARWNLPVEGNDPSRLRAPVCTVIDAAQPPGDSPHARFFLERVPDFAEGVALAVCAPITLRTLATGALRQARRRLASAGGLRRPASPEGRATP